MFEMPSPKSRPSLTNAIGWKPRTPASHGSRPEYEVSMWPLNMRLGPPPSPGQVPSTLARPSSTCCHCTCRPISANVSRISSAIACSSPVKLGVAIACDAQSTRRSSLIAIAAVIGDARLNERGAERDESLRQRNGPPERAVSDVTTVPVAYRLSAADTRRR